MPLALFRRGPSGNTVDESVKVCQWLVEAGVDAIHVSTGSFFPHPRNPGRRRSAGGRSGQVVRHDDLERRADVPQLPAVSRRLRRDRAARVERRRRRSRQDRGREPDGRPRHQAGRHGPGDLHRRFPDGVGDSRRHRPRRLRRRRAPPGRSSPTTISSRCSSAGSTRRRSPAPTATSAWSTSSRTRWAVTTSTRFESRDEMIDADHVGLSRRRHSGGAAVTRRHDVQTIRCSLAVCLVGSRAAFRFAASARAWRRRTTSSRTSSTARSEPKGRSACRIRSGACCRCSSPTSCRSGPGEG